eukprot:EG_transcript_4587
MEENPASGGVPTRPDPPWGLITHHPSSSPRVTKLGKHLRLHASWCAWPFQLRHDCSVVPWNLMQRTVSNVLWQPLAACSFGPAPSAVLCCTPTWVDPKYMVANGNELCAGNGPTHKRRKLRGAKFFQMTGMENYAIAGLKPTKPSRNTYQPLAALAPDLHPRHRAQQASLLSVPAISGAPSAA